MPIEFPSINDDGKPIDVTYYTTEEASRKLHVTEKTLRERLRRGEWPHLHIAGRYYLSDVHLARIVERLTVDPDDVSRLWREESDARRLGLVGDDESGVS